MADNTRIDELVSTLLAHSDRHFQFAWITQRRGETREQFLSEQCKTPACAAGWAIMLWGSDEEVRALTRPVYGMHLAEAERAGSIFEAAQHALGLTGEQARWIFLQSAALADPNEAAIWALKHLKDHPHANALELTLAARGAGLINSLLGPLPRP